MIKINKDMTKSQLRTTGLLLLLFMGLIGALARFRFGAPTVAWVLWGAGVALAAVYYAVPSTRRPIYLGWMYAVYPIGWVASHVILGVVFYLVVTPVGLIVRLVGSDPMTRRIDRAAASYWVRREGPIDRARYFRQF